MAAAHPAGAHALLADGRTAALVDPEGGIAWLCWPRVDSAPCLLPILDPARGGCFRLAPVAGGRILERAYLPGSLVLRTVWSAGAGRLVVEEALSWDGPPRLERRLRCESAAVEVEVVFDPAFGAASSPAVFAIDGEICEAEGAGTRLAVAAPGPWRRSRDGVRARVRLEPGEGAAVVLAGSAAEARAAGLEATLVHWRRLDAMVDTSRLVAGGAAARALGAATAERLVRLSALVLAGLCQRGGGMVAAPTTSLPQWPGSSRTWDYRYSWPRDTALAGLALLRCGLVEPAAGLGDFLGRACAGGAAPSLLRVDGSPAPEEVELAHLAGHGGARPVRIGNAAALQVQVDVLGEVLDLAAALERAGALPDPLRAAAPGLADAAATGWSRPDHGIWEVRGPARVYTHSRLMAWTGLRRAAALRRRGAIGGDAAAWERAAARLRTAVLAGATPAAGLSLHPDGGGPDAALALLPLVGFLPGADPRVHATLDSIATGLDRDGLLERYQGSRDGLDDPCAAFVFPTFWLAAALERCGRDGAPRLAAAAACRGDLDLLAETALAGRPQGNLPQAQSHAALIMACLAGPPGR